MPITLNAPDVNCLHCRGKGARVRELKLVLEGTVTDSTAQVLLHCSCLAAELVAAHDLLEVDGVLRDWPWADLEGQVPPKADNGPEIEVVGCPYPAAISVAPSSPPAKPVEPVPDSVPNPAKAKRKKSKGRR